MPYAPLLNPQEVQERLLSLEGWELDAERERISRRFRFPTFRDSIAFVNRVAELAEAADHHPDIVINFTRVTISLTTYASKGLTHKDFGLAGEVQGGWAK